MDRTIVLNLRLTREQAALLQRTLAEYTACFNTVAHLGFTQQCRNDVELHKQTYYPLRAQYPDLPAQLVCAARVKATEAVNWVKWEAFTCSLATRAGRVELPFSVPSPAQKYIGGKVCSADLIYRKGKWTLHVSVSIPEPPVPPSTDVIGVDLGLNAAHNIREKYLASLASLGRHLAGGLPVKQPIVSDLRV